MIILTAILLTALILTLMARVLIIFFNLGFEYIHPDLITNYVSSVRGVVCLTVMLAVVYIHCKNCSS